MKKDNDTHCDRCDFDYPFDYAQTRFGAPEDGKSFVINGVCGYCEYAERNGVE